LVQEAVDQEVEVEVEQHLETQAPLEVQVVEVVLEYSVKDLTVQVVLLQDQIPLHM
jgi:hypothetical protein